jgi:enoyl-CoA hydratase/carnithine racemase
LTYANILVACHGKVGLINLSRPRPARDQPDGRLRLHGRLQGRLHHPQAGAGETCRKPMLAAVAGFALAEGQLFERRQFHAAFALQDQKEGMAAFLEKHKAQFKNR